MTRFNFDIKKFENSLSYAKFLDENDPLSSLKTLFYIPKRKSGEDIIYFLGNSLGLQPKRTKYLVEAELKRWGEEASNAHVNGSYPWINYHQTVAKSLAKLTGAKESEVVAMNSLTANLHFLMVSFYRPNKKRYKIVIEKQAFPSDYYAVLSQLKFHGFGTEALIEVAPKTNSFTINTSDYLQILEDNCDNIALILLPGVQYYTGQVFDMSALIKKGHEIGAIVGIDLAHTIGNIPLELHSWEADFAIWCSYKYLNSGPGGIGGAFVHEKHINKELPRFHGWWGSNQATRFKMKSVFEPINSVEAWQLSNPPILQLASLRASLNIFDTVGIKSLRQKSIYLTGYLNFLLEKCSAGNFNILTPSKPEERGCQLSIKFLNDAYRFFRYLQEQGVACDYRHPEVIRIAPAPLYNSFAQVFKLYQIIKTGLRV